jgi:multiple sugar transport system ATP-binding protein
MNFLQARIERRDGGAVAVLDGAGEVVIADGDAAADHHGEQLTLGIRAENIDLATDLARSGLRGRVMVVEPLGSHNLVTLRIGEGQIKATTRPDTRLQADQEVSLLIDARHIRWLDPQGLAIDGREAAGPGAGMGAPQPGELETTAPSDAT